MSEKRLIQDHKSNAYQKRFTIMMILDVNLCS
jgi:hypothetical protein